jgi:predicted polyphosphate/ATP-dependent NAD kinase
MPPAPVGIVANPASGRDIRRLVSGASVFDNAEKGSMVYRLLAGLGAAGAETVLMMPAAGSVLAPLRRHLIAHRDGRLPELELLPGPVTETVDDTYAAVDAMVAAGVAGIAVLGGDGTHRAVAKRAGDTPLLALSTGTNNAFPEMREATVAGLALGLLAAGRVDPAEATRRERALRVDGAGPDLALVDVAVSKERWVGARALWRPGEIAELFVAFARPDAIGLSAIAAALEPCERAGDHGLHVRLAPLEEATTVVSAPIAPGLVTRVGVAAHAPLALGEPVAVAAGTGALALDGEREIERDGSARLTVTLVPGPRTLDVAAALRLARVAT